MRVGFVINPVAGMGARVGLKGTDGLVDEARRRGAHAVAPARAAAFLAALAREPEFVTAAGSMGEDALESASMSALVVFSSSAVETTSDDTRRAAAEFVAAGADVIVFVGGDGTAADVADVVGTRVPILGVPSGAKMFSAVFAESPEAAARILDAGWDATREAEVLDVDEAAFRRGEVAVALKAIVRVPASRAVQSAKWAGDDDVVEQETLGRAVADALDPRVTYILAGGSTMAHVKRALGFDGTLLGIDAWRGGHVAGLDLGERELLALPPPTRIVLSPIGRQGFLLGRGNLPITPEVVSRAGGPGEILTVATPTKLGETPTLTADTG
ncbi:MAG: ATP-NAD kinase family protein, partial [Thermoplasmatota archaeon]